MAMEPPEPSRAGDGAPRLLACAAAAGRRVGNRLQDAIDDLLRADDARLDDRQRAAVTTTFHALVAIVEGDLREHGAKLLAGRGDVDGAAGLADAGKSVSPRLWRAGLARDPAFMHELIARARLDLLTEVLPGAADPDPDRASLLPRLAEHADRVVADAAMAALVADNRRRAGDPGARTDLPGELHHMLVWWVAAALRGQAGGDGDVAGLDRALTEAAQRNLVVHDEGARPEAAAMRLARALDARGAALPELLIEALADRRAALFAAVLAHALAVPFEAARELMLDRGGERLWLACRALDLPRDAIARIGVMLAEADPRRDLERFADQLDMVAAISVETARAALAPLWLRPDYRAALDALGGER